MTPSTRIYAGGAFAFGGQPAVDDLLASGYDTLIVWSVHVQPDGTLVLNDTQIVEDGVYGETEGFDLPGRIAQLKARGMSIIFSVGAGGTSDFTNIAALLDGAPAGPGNPLYDNFAALKQAMVHAGGDIDAIDFDNEDNLDATVMANFAITLNHIGYGSVTFCPYADQPVWFDTMGQIVAALGASFVSAIHLQCYSGGMWNQSQLPAWIDGFAAKGGTAPMIPGLGTEQAGPGPWWHNGAPGTSVVSHADVAMYEGADWSNYLYTKNYPSADAALQDAHTAASFFFYCTSPMVLTNGYSFQTGDAAFFSGVPWWGSAPQATGYTLSGGCSDTYNGFGACPSDLQGKFASWKSQGIQLGGGFIWMYDSVISCLLSGCCGGSFSQPATTALAYRQAITNGLG